MGIVTRSLNIIRISISQSVAWDSKLMDKKKITTSANVCEFILFKQLQHLFVETLQIAFESYLETSWYSNEPHKCSYKLTVS